MTDNRTTERTNYPQRTRKAIDELMVMKDGAGNRTTELLPCPFCSAKPELWSDSRRTWGLVQHKDGCLFPNIRKHEIPEEYFAAWNARAERTCRIEGRYGNQYCTCCGEMVGTWDSTSELYIDGNMVELWNYCPNCGAKVVGE